MVQFTQLWSPCTCTNLIWLKQATIHKATMLVTPKNVLLPGQNHLLMTRASLWLLPEHQLIVVFLRNYLWYSAACYITYSALCPLPKPYLKIALPVVWLTVVKPPAASVCPPDSTLKRINQVSGIDTVELKIWNTTQDRLNFLKVVLICLNLPLRYFLFGIILRQTVHDLKICAKIHVQI